MRNLIVFIQSVSGREWEVGEIIDSDIKHNPTNLCCTSEVFHIKSFKGLNEKLKLICEKNQDASIIIQIVAHSNLECIGFKDVNSQNRDEFCDYAKWSEIEKVLNYLYKSNGTNITVIFISCYSSIFAESLKSPHVPIIAADGEIVARRAEEQLIRFYEKLCAGSTMKEAFDYMANLFPIENELCRNENDRSILKLYM